MAYKYLYEYYVDKDFTPTFARFSGEEHLSAYDTMRQMVFRDKFSLPPAVFRGADVLEFGPDTGENSLVFARWGANLHLVEPNEGVHQQIRDYFAGFSLQDRLKALHTGMVDTFRSEREFNLIVAEGFIYTIRPERRWLSALRPLVAKNGLVIVSYYERHGGFIELAVKALVARYVQCTGVSPIEAARTLLQAKWDSIPHTRSFDSWARDVLFNPFVRLEYFINPERLIAAAREEGFGLFSSWPGYRQPLKPYWHKKSLPAEEVFRLDCLHLRRSRLSFLLGEMAYLTDEPTQVEDRIQTIERAVESIDAAIDPETSTQSFSRCAEAVSDLASLVSGRGVLCESEERRTYLDALLETLRDMFSVAAAGDAAALRSRCSEDPRFIGAWGMPTHYAVFRRE